MMWYIDLNDYEQFQVTALRRLLDLETSDYETFAEFLNAVRLWVVAMRRDGNFGDEEFNEKYKDLPAM